MTRTGILLAIWFGLQAATGHAIDFQITLDPGQAVPAPALGGSTPTGDAIVSVNTITGDVSISGNYAGLTSNVAASHLHGLAPVGIATGVIFGLTNSGGQSGTISGASTLSASNLDGLLNGQTYINIHTSTNGAGEIRGQVVDSDIRVFDMLLSPDQAVPSPNLGGATPSGMARVVIDMSNGEIEISGNYAGMTSDVLAAHLHGPALPGVAAGVMFGFSTSGGTSGAFSGSSTLASDELTDFLAGLTYINVHTSTNGAGEIRGQVVPEPAAIALVTTGLLSLMARRRRRGRLVA